MARDPSDYAFWRAALKGAKQSVQESNPQCGFYKVRRGRDKPWAPIAFWRSREGEVVCGFQGSLVDPIEHWTYAAKNPVAEPDYRFAVNNYGRWPDEPAPPPAASNGSNMPSDPFEALKAEIDDKMEQSESFLKRLQVPGVPTSTDANMARNIQAALLQLNKRADEMFKVEKQPHVEAGRAVDSKFAFRKPVQDIAERLRKVFEAFMRAEEARQRAEAQKKFEEDRRKAEEARKAAEAERKELEESDPFLAHTIEHEPLPELPLAPEPVKINVGGGVGRRAGLKTVYEAIVEDWGIAAAHYSDHPDVQAVVQKLANADAKNSKGTMQVPGVKMYNDRRAA